MKPAKVESMMEGSGDYCRPCPCPESFIKCGRIPSQTCRIPFSLPQDPVYNIDPQQPIIVEWPPNKREEETCPEVDTGPRPDLLAMIPDSMAPQTFTVVATPSPQAMAKAGGTMGQALPHELCPDGQMHVRIDPKQEQKREFRLPVVEPPVKGPPCRPWVQCVENTLINDRVRRPMARICHKRPPLPLVIPVSKLNDLHLKATERQRKREAIEAYCRERECQRLKSRQRHAKWNYTVESVLDRKRQIEAEKAAAESEADKRLIQEFAKEKEAQSAAQIAKAKEMAMYRKGLIRDFNSALAYSKIMQENERLKAMGKDLDESHCPLTVQRCYRKPMYINDTRPDHTVKKEEQEKKCNERLLQKLREIEQRAKEQKEEMNREICEMKQEIAANLPELPESYKKYLANPPCNSACEDKQAEHERKRAELFEEIGDKLAADAYQESWELEIERQAREYASYKADVDAIRKAKEKQDIEEKVALNQARSEAAAKALLEIQKKNQPRAGFTDYDRFKEEWESDWKDKERKKKIAFERHMERVCADYNNRKSEEEKKWCGMSAARDWAREQLVAQENYEKECDPQEEEKRKKVEAEDVSLFNQALVAHKHKVAQQKKELDHALSLKMRQDYLDEMKEMKAYACRCIEEWKAKGRSTFPMELSMKKWDYDAGMFPFMFGEGDSPITKALAERVSRNKKKGGCEEYETSSMRLGFSSGGT